MPRGRPRRFTEDQLRQAIAESRCWSHVLRRLRYRNAGGNSGTVQKYAALWEIDTTHFDSAAVIREALQRRPARPLEEILVENSSYNRGQLKRRILAAGLKKRRCELCGQGEEWRGGRMALILDHVNGVPDDNRLENLRIVCPNCNATLPTHCGRKNKTVLAPRTCPICLTAFHPNDRRQRYCSRACGSRYPRTSTRGVPRPGTRKVLRPSYEELMEQIESSGYSAVGRRYGVSDNAVRKWVRWYELEQERSGQDG